jgi:diaminopimelate epimerase
MANSSLPFAKLSGGGNDFVVVDNRTSAVSDPAALALRICTRGLSVGADGLILVEDSSSADFRMIYYNSDGSRADFCANGTRCAARFAHMSRIAPSPMTIETDAGLVGAIVDAEGEVTLSLASPRNFRPRRALRVANGMMIEGSSILVGVPHYVIFLRDLLWEQDIDALGREIRHHPDLHTDGGANVNFVRVVDEQRLEVRTWERGVEAETMACGSGVVASTAVAALFRRVSSPLSVRVRSGIVYRVEFAVETRAGEPMIDRIRLRGDSRHVFRSALTDETLTGFDAGWVRAPRSDPS